MEEGLLQFDTTGGKTPSYTVKLNGEIMGKPSNLKPTANESELEVTLKPGSQVLYLLLSLDNLDVSDVQVQRAGEDQPTTLQKV